MTIMVRDFLHAYGHERIKVAGSFVPGKYGVQAAKTWTIAATNAITFTMDAAGVTNSTYTVEAAADGNAKATLSPASNGCTMLDNTIRFKTAGVGGNAWKVVVVPGSGTGEGVNISEDTTNKILTIMYETAVSTVANVNTAIGTTTNFEVSANGTTTNTLAAATDTMLSTSMAGGTVATWVEWATGAISTLKIHFTNLSTTVTQLLAAVNAVVTGKFCTASATGTASNTLATADAFAAADFAGGVNSTAIAATYGKGFSVAQTAIGTYTITFDTWFPTLLSPKFGLTSNAAVNLHTQGGAFTAASKTLVVRTVTAAGAAADIASISTNDRVNFICEFANTQLG